MACQQAPVRASCHPACQELLQASKVSFQLSKPQQKKRRFSCVFTMSAISLVLSILDAQGTQNDTKWALTAPRDLPRPPKVDPRAPKVTTQSPKIGQWHPMAPNVNTMVPKMHPKTSKAVPNEAQRPLNQLPSEQPPVSSHNCGLRFLEFSNLVVIWQQLKPVQPSHQLAICCPSFLLVSSTRGPAAGAKP